MSLHLIHGPLNSGRTGLLRRRLDAAAGRNPILICPSLPARRQLEREITAASAGSRIGVEVTGFEKLAATILAAAGEKPPPRAGAAQTTALTEAAIRAAAGAGELRILARSAASPGFVRSITRLFSELRSEQVRPDREVRDDAYLREILTIYGRYLSLLERAGLTDATGLVELATVALKADPDSWARRPVLLHGFERLEPDRLGLILELARTAPVTVTVTHEDRLALSARARLLGELRANAPEPPSEEATVPSSANTASPLLYHLERHFGERQPPRHEADGSLRLLRAAGERGEAELIAAELKALLAGGDVRASEVAIALRSPDLHGPGLAAVLAGCGIPVALEARLPLARTATGSALLALLDACFGERSADSLLRYLRGPQPPERLDATDAVERRVLRRRLTTAAQALEAWRRESGEPLAEVEALRAAAAGGDDGGDATAWPLGAEIARRARRLALNAGEDRSGVEARAAAAVGTLVEDLERLPGDRPGPPELIEALGRIEVETWSGDAGERVRIAGPYALYTVRSARVRHLFVASLQDREFPRRGGEGPFLSDEQRLRLGMRERISTELEETYLFQVCLAIPTEGLWLSCRMTDDEGREAQASPFLERVTEMIEPGWPGPIVIERGLDALVFEPARAPSRADLRRAEAVAAPPSPAALNAAKTRPLRHPAVLAELSARHEFGASELEQFATRPADWFVERELEPALLGPDPAQLTDGTIAHAALERLYTERPGGTPLPTPQSLPAWRNRAAELVAEATADAGRSAEQPLDRAAARRIERYLACYLETQAQGRAEGLEPRLLEASFGSREGCEKPALDLPGWALAGVIDRVDTEPPGRLGLIHDYKLSATATPQAKFAEKARLQPGLYALALRELWGIEPIGALYVPLRATGCRPRGFALAEPELGEVLAGLSLTHTDRVDRDRFEQLIAAARELATETVASIRAGAIDRPPLAGAYPSSPAAAAIHRRFADRLAAIEAGLEDEENGA